MGKKKDTPTTVKQKRQKKRSRVTSNKRDKPDKRKAKPRRLRYHRDPYPWIDLNVDVKRGPKGPVIKEHSLTSTKSVPSSSKGGKSRKRRKSSNRKKRKSKRRGSRRSRRSHYKLPPVPKGTKFIKGSGRYKYSALLPNGKRVNFGHRDYQHYRDRVPKNKGGKLWTHLNHNDRERMENYRSRHRGVKTKDGTPAYKKKYSASWFSYHYLW